jgi:formylglycine-generating enzyme required for sulfatase activity
MSKQHTLVVRGLFGAMILLAGFSSARATQLSIWARQSDLRATAGDPNTSLAPASIAYNPGNGQMLIACSGNNASILEWPRGATAGTLLVPRSNWGASGIPQPYASAFIPNRGTYLVGTGTDDVIYEVIPGAAGQTPTAFVTPAPLTFPAGGMVQDGNYAYYKNQWTSVQQTVNRFVLSGSTAVDSVYIPKSAFDAWNLAGPSRQLAMNSAQVLYLAGQPSSSTYNSMRGIYRWDTATSALVRVLTNAQILAFTGQTNVGVYGMVFDAEDSLYFYEIYASGILRLDRRGNLSLFLTDSQIRSFMGDSSMQVNPAFMQVVNNELVFLSGNVSGHILAARLPLVDPDLATVPATDYEPNGPAYTYRIDRFEVTNAQYAVFLNDAQKIQQTDPNDPRCANMWIDPSNGDVYMMNVTGFPLGNEWYDRTLYKTSDSPDSKIKYHLNEAPGNRFYVLPGFAHHPVGTVSWFGATKFCNWLTINNGLDAAQRCYREGTSKTEWYPITAANWAANGLTAAERFDLVRHYRGYRLVMDGQNTDGSGPGIGTSWNNGVNPYSEWYKAAAFDPNAPATTRAGPGTGETVPPNHWTFGFGADAFSAADANLLASNPPFDETTPVGWYDGVNLLADSTPTSNTRNRYGLYDLCGDATEWLNDPVLNSPWDSTYRATRGGSFSTNDAKYATNSARSVTSARYCAENSLTFRVVRSPGYADFDGNGTIDVIDFAFFATAMSGPDVAIVPGSGYEACDASGDADVDLADFAVFQPLFRFSQ